MNRKAKERKRDRKGEIYGDQLLKLFYSFALKMKMFGQSSYSQEISRAFVREFNTVPCENRSRAVLNASTSTTMTLQGCVIMLQEMSYLTKSKRNIGGFSSLPSGAMTLIFEIQGTRERTSDML